MRRKLTKGIVGIRYLKNYGQIFNALVGKIKIVSPTHFVLEVGATFQLRGESNTSKLDASKIAQHIIKISNHNLFH